MGRLFETLEHNTKSASFALKELLGAIELEPIQGDCIVENGKDIEMKSYSIAHTNIQTLGLLDEKSQGSNWLHWRRGWDSNPRYVYSAHTLSKRAP